MVGIVSYGVSIPRYRIKCADIARAWGKNPQEIIPLQVIEKAVPAVDEDAITLAIDASQNAFLSTNRAVSASSIGLLIVGSESHPYAVNPSATIVGELLGTNHQYLALDSQFACKAATSGLQLAAGLISAGKITNGLVIGADTAQSRPHDTLEYTSAASAAALVLGNENTIANLVDFTSYSSDTPDFWRRDGAKYPIHTGRFTGQPSYFTHIWEAGNSLLKKTNTSAEKIDYCVFHMPNGRFPRQIAKKFGFTREQLAPSLTVEKLGNPYSASALIGLIAVLEQAKPNQTIFMVSYGSGAGSDAFLWKTTKKTVSFQQSVFKQKMSVQHQVDKKTYIDYTKYLQMTHKI